MKVVDRGELMANARARLEDFRRFRQAGLIPRDGDFFPSVHYPPITMYPPTTEEELFETYTLPEDGLFDVYAHLPFCQRRCIFCHYPVKLGDQHDEKERYLAALEREMDIYMARLGVDVIKTRSILVGGGTPTFLTPKQLQRFLDYFVRRLDMSQCGQFNYDVDPGSLVGPEGLDRLKIMRDYGVDRLTIGVQSLNEEILRLMNRPHGVQEALDSIENSRRFGYQINIEFIFGHPGMTIENWIEVMEQAVSLDVDEIQLYRLKVEAYGDYQGPIKRFKHLKPEQFPSHEDAIMMKQVAIDILNANGFHENLRRVFSKKREHYSLYAHDQCCMLYDEIGLGLTAFSSLRDRFVLNTQDFDEYYRKIDEGKLPLNRGLVRSPEEQMRWAIILPLKNRDIHKPSYERITGASLNQVFRKKIDNLKSFGLIEENEEFMQLTRLGAFFADEVAEQFHSPDYMPFPQSAYEHEGALCAYENCTP